MSRIDLNAALARVDAIVAAFSAELRRFQRLRRMLIRLSEQNALLKGIKKEKHTVDTKGQNDDVSASPVIRIRPKRNSSKVERRRVRELIHEYVGSRTSGGSLDDIVTFIAGECGGSATNQHFRTTVSKVLNEETAKGVLVAEGRRGSTTWRAAA